MQHVTVIDQTVLKPQQPTACPEQSGKIFCNKEKRTRAADSAIFRGPCMKSVMSGLSTSLLRLLSPTLSSLSQMTLRTGLTWRGLTLPRDGVHQRHLCIINIHCNAKSGQQIRTRKRTSKRYNNEYFWVFSWILRAVLTFLYTTIKLQKWVVLQPPGGHNMTQFPFWWATTYKHCGPQYKTNSAYVPNVANITILCTWRWKQNQCLKCGFPIKTTVMNKVQQ